MATLKSAYDALKNRKSVIEAGVNEAVKAPPKSKKKATKKKGSSYADSLYRRARTRKKREEELTALDTERKRLMKELEKYKKETY